MDKESYNTHNIVRKFKEYRWITESIENQLKEAKITILHLKDEVSLLREKEKLLSISQESYPQNRIIQLLEVLNKIIAIADQQEHNENTAIKNEKKIEELTVESFQNLLIPKAIKEVHEKIEVFLCRTSKELNLLKENEKLSGFLKSSKCECKLLKAEIELLKKDKNEEEMKYQERVKNLINEIEKVKEERDEEKIQYHKNIILYKKEIDSKEEIIKEYEKEIKSILDEFAPPKEIETSNSVVFSWPNHTLHQYNEKRSNKSTNEQNISRTQPKWKNDLTKQLFEKTNNSKIKEIDKFNQMNTTNKHSDMFQNCSEASEEPPRKRRLFSNFNHYLT